MTQRVQALALLATAVFAVDGAAAPPPQPPHGLSTPVRVVSVHDGDTVTVEYTARIQVRLNECWAPELREGGGPESGEALRNAALEKNGTLFIPSGDIKHLGQLTTLGRVVGWLWLDGETESLNQRQVRTGHASTRKGLPRGQ